MLTSSALGLVCCQAVLAILGNKVSFPGSLAYNQSLNSYFTLQAATAYPQCIVSPETANDVQAAVISLQNPHFNHEGRGCEFAIRSGGHGTAPNVSSIRGGVVLDLRALDSIELVGETSDVSVGVGATWGAVYDYLDNLGLSVAGGRASAVGVGGLTLGGGISYFSPRYGWTCDSVMRLEIVLANGSVIRASRDQNPELLRALRGGGNNFGVVTRFEFKTFTQGPVWSANLYYNLSTAEDQIREIVRIISANEYDENASFTTTFGYSAPQGLAAIASNLIYTKVESTNNTPKVYEGLLSFPTIIRTMNVTSTSSLARITGEMQKNGHRQLYTSITLKPTESILIAVYLLWSQSLNSIKGIEGVVWGMTFDPLPSSSYAPKSQHNSLGLSDRKGTLIIAQLAVTWDLSADDVTVMYAARRLMGAIEKRARELNVFDPFVYANYAAQWQDTLASYGSISVQKLRDIRREVDPQGVFTYNVPGGFKIPT
ncbi:putative oxidoreductase [Xylaria curta]|nr:putative oxidoreductase [Xylaria curta]